MIVRRSHTTVIALCVIAGAAAVAALIHLLLGLLSLDIAVAKTSEEDRQAAQALTQLFETQHPRVRIRTIYEPDRLGTAAALDTSETQLTLVRSDAAPKDGQTLVILRRDAIVFVAPGGSTVDSVAKLKGSTVGLLDGRKLDPRLLDPILTHFGAPPASVHRKVPTIDQLTEAGRSVRCLSWFPSAAPYGCRCSRPCARDRGRRSGRRRTGGRRASRCAASPCSSPISARPCSAVEPLVLHLRQDTLLHRMRNGPRSRPMADLIVAMRLACSCLADTGAA